MNVPDIGTFHKQITAVGSRVTCNPPAVGTDQDWLVWVGKDDFEPLADFLEANGWDFGVVVSSRVPNRHINDPHDRLAPRPSITRFRPALLLAGDHDVVHEYLDFAEGLEAG